MESKPSSLNSHPQAPDHGSGGSWFVVLVSPGAELEINLDFIRPFVNDLYVPMIDYTYKHRRTKKIVRARRPAFPGYMFIQTPARLFALMDFSFIRGFVRQGPGHPPYQLNDSVVQAIRSVESEGLLGAVPEEMMPQYHKGQQVTSEFFGQKIQATLVHIADNVATLRAEVQNKKVTLKKPISEIGAAA